MEARPLAGMLRHVARMRRSEFIAIGTAFSERRGFLRACLAGALLPLLPACEPAGRRPLRIGTNTWTGYETLHVAVASGLVPQGGVHLARMPSTTSVLQGLMAGQFDAAGVTLDELLSAREDGLDLRIVAVLDVSAGADSILARPGLETREQLRGRTVVVEKTAVGAVLLDAFLQSVGLEPADMHLSYLPADGHVDAWREGWADVVVTFDPASIEIEAAGGRRIFDSSMTPGRIIDVLAAVAPCDALCTRRLAALLTGHFTVLDRLAEGSGDVELRMARGLGLEVEQLRGSLARLDLPDLRENLEWLSGSPAPIETAARDIARVMQRAELLAGPPRLQDFLDASVLEQVASA
jgi:NitT/TauT family transport system substrate-binding protein